MGQLLLGQVIEHIALILALVQPLFQQPAAGGLVLLHPGVMARDHILHAMALSPAEQVVELHIPVAVDAGVGRAAHLVYPDEFFDDLLPEVGGEIQHLIGDIHRKGHLGGILDILFGAAGMETGLPQRLVSGEPHQPCRHRAVHTAAHGDECPGALRVLCFCHIVPHSITH